MTTVKFGVAGFPIAFTESELRKDRLNIFKWLHELGLDALELQMTYGPRMLPENCIRYAREAAEWGIRLTVHASYFIVFTSSEKEKIERSADTLKRTYELMDLLGTDIAVLHPGPLYNEDAADAMNRFVDHAGDALESIGKTEIGLFVETAGKVGQLGSVEEILTISDQLGGVHPCIDFGHVHARTLGTLEAPENIFALTRQLGNYLDENPEKRIHFHYTPIHFGPRGEIKHRALGDRYPPINQEDLFGGDGLVGRSKDGLFHPRPETVAEAIKSIDRDFVVVSETHNSQEEGAKHLKREFMHRH